MPLLRIAQIGHPVLRESARELTRSELLSARWQGFIDDLVATMHDANGAGLAANQVHQAVQICALEVKPNNPRYPYKPPIPLTIVVNPQIEPLGSDTFDNYEGCLSVPNIRGVVPRWRRVRVRFWDRHGEPQERHAEGLEAGTYQHEIDHLFGKLFLDRVADQRTLTTWENFHQYHERFFVQRLRDTGVIGPA